MRHYYIIESLLPLSVLDSESTQNDLGSIDNTIEFENYNIEIYSYSTSPYEANIVLQIVPHKPYGFHVCTFDSWETWTMLFDEIKRELYVIIEDKLYVFYDVYINATLEKCSYCAIENNDLFRNDNFFKRMIFGSDTDVDKLTRDEKLQIIMKQFDKEKNHLKMNVSEAKNSCVSLCFDTFHLKDLSELMNKCFKSCVYHYRIINLYKYDNHILIRTGCSEKVYILKCSKYDFMNPKLNKFCDIIIVTHS